MKIIKTDIKISITIDFYNKLINDMMNFGYRTLENKGSETNFFREIILKTYEYQNKIKKIEKIKSILTDNKITNNEILDDINKHKNTPNFNKCLTDIAVLLSTTLYNEDRIPEQEKKEIHIKGTKSTSYELEDILNEKKQLSNSNILKSLLYDYMNYPLYTREMILFGNLYDKIKTNTKNNFTSIITTNKGKVHEIEVYDINAGKTEFHYYITGFFHDQTKKTFSLKLCNVKSVLRGETYLLSAEKMNEAKEKMKEGAEWFGNEVKKIIVSLDDEGMKRYNNFYVDRPSYIKFDRVKKEMTFLCSTQQIFNYFVPFGRHAVVINNQELKNRILKHHKYAYEEYNNKKDN